MLRARELTQVMFGPGNPDQSNMDVSPHTTPHNTTHDMLHTHHTHIPTPQPGTVGVHASASQRGPCNAVCTGGRAII